MDFRVFREFHPGNPAIPRGFSDAPYEINDLMLALRVQFRASWPGGGDTMTTMSIKGHATINDLLNTPKDGRKYELVDGEILVSPAGMRTRRLVPESRL